MHVMDVLLDLDVLNGCAADMKGDCSATREMNIRPVREGSLSQRTSISHEGIGLARLGDSDYKRTIDPDC